MTRDRADTPYSLAEDAKSIVATRYGLESYPTLVLIDRQGVIHRVMQGADETLEPEIQRLLKTSSSQRP